MDRSGSCTAVGPRRSTATARHLISVLAGTTLVLVVLTGVSAVPAGAASIKYAAIVGDAGGTGYWLVQSGGSTVAHGSAPAPSNTDGDPLFTAPVLGAVATPDHLGFWEYNANGGLACFGDATDWGSGDPHTLPDPTVGMASTYDGHGYVMVDRIGDVISWGDACYLGSPPARTKHKPIVAVASYPFGSASCPSTGYWVVGSTGTVYPFGTAAAYGTTTSPSPIVTLVSTPSGLGYWELAKSGVITNFGDAASLGWTSVVASRRMVSMAITPSGAGYWELGLTG